MVIGNFPKLKAKQEELEEQYRSSVVALEIEEKHALAKIKRARSTPRKHKHLKAIYEAHQEGLLKLQEIKVTCAKMITGLNMNPTPELQLGTISIK